MAEQPTAEEIAAYEAQFGPAKPSINPLRDLSAEDIAALAVKDKEHFVIPDEFARAKELHGDPAFVQKVADAFNIVNQRGFKLEDLPSVPQAAGAVGTAVKGLAGQAWNYANVAGNVLAGAASELVGAEGLAGGYAENISKRLAENVAGTEEAMTGLSQIAQKGARKAGQISGIAKDFSEYTPAEKVTELFNKSGESEVRNERLTGKGEFSKAVTGGQGGELNPEKVGELAAGDPFSFYLFGGVAGAAGKALKAVTPAVVSGAASAITRGVTGLAEQVLPKVVGGGLTAAGVTAKGAAKAVETVAPAAGAIGGGIAGGASYGVPGAIAGVGAGFASGKAIARGAGFVGRQAEKLADVGRQVAGSVPIKSAYTQAGRDFLQAIPGAAGEVAKGAALDLGLAAATAEVPQDVQGAVGFGTALGALSGVARVGGRVVSGQLIAPRSYGVNTVVPSSGQFRGLDTMHADAMKAAQPGVKARLNAMRDFAQGVAPGTDIFLGRDSAAVERALLDAGVASGTAKAWSQAEGFFTTDLPGKDGQPRRVVIARNVDSVPHEAQHIIQDVLGEEANQRIDALIKDTYADQWENEGQKYADRLTERGDPRNWREVILDETGTGLSEAKEKIYRDIYNRLETESGIAPSPKLVEEMAKADLGQRMDDAVVRHPDADPNAIGRRVWRDVFQDAPEEVIRLSDKYIARELAAENFDAIFKNQGPRLAEGTQLPQRLARIVGGVMSAFGSEPLAGRVSELGGTPLSTPVIEAVRNAAKGLQGETPVIAPREPATVRPRGLPGSAEAVQGAAEEARTIAASAPAEVAIGGTRSPRELLGQIAESIANQEGVKINYLSAPGEPAAATTSNRTVRREIIEAFRTMPPEARALWEKTFFPDRVIRTKSGAYQIQGWAPEVFASNAHKLAKFFAETPGSEVLSPYAIDATAKTFTPEAWQELYRDTQDFVQNQIRGATGSGEPLVVPKSVTDAGGFAPPTRPGAVPLAQGKADFINALFNFKLPETPRVQVGKRPLNVIGQEVSGATIPGRVEVPVRPRGAFTGEEAARQGIEGVNIAEVNPFRNQLEAAAAAAGKPPPSFIEAIQKLNLENIKEVEGTPESPQFRGNTLTLTAGLQPAIQQRATERSWRISGQVRGANKQITVNAPDIAAARKLAEAQNMRISRVENADKVISAQLAARTDTGRRVAEERGFEIRHTGTPENPGVAMFKDGVPVGEISAVRNSAIEADIDNIKVNTGFRGQGLSEILYREMGRRLQDEGVETVTGMIIDKRALAGRSKVFPETKVENEIQIGENAPAYEVRSPISATAQFSPVELAARVEKFTPDEFRKWASSPEGANNNFTGVAHDVGLQAPDRAFVDSLKQRYDAISKQSTDLLAGIRSDPATMMEKLDTVSALASQGQFFREAYEAATGTASAGNALRKADPNYKPPFPLETIEAAAKFAPKKLTNDDSYSWLSPDGNFIPISAGKTHSDMVPSILKKAGATIEDAWKAGYARIIRYGDEVTAHKEIGDLSRKQRTALTDLAIETGKSKVDVDTGDDLKVIFHADYDTPETTAQLAPKKKKTGEEKERPIAAAIRLPGGKIYEGKTHDKAFREAELFGENTQDIDNADSGFLTNTGRYVSRKEASRLTGVRGEFDSTYLSQLDAEGKIKTEDAQLAPRKEKAEDLELRDIPAQFAPPKKAGALETEAEAQKRIAETDYSKYNVKPKTPKRKAVKTEGETVKVFHFSNRNDLTQTDPALMRTGVYGANKFWGQENPKTFFFMEGSEGKPGAQFKNRTAYTAEIPKARLYDATKTDPLEYASKINREEADAAVIDAGYAGVIVPIKGGQKVVVMFDPVDVSPSGGKTDASGDFKAQFAAKKSGDELGLVIPKDERRLQRLAGAQVKKNREKHPEALPLELRTEEDGSYSIDKDGDPVPVSIQYGLDVTPLAKQAAKGIRGEAARENAVARAYADKIKSSYDAVKTNPAVMAGANWYSLARERLQKLFGEDTKFFCELLAATSARTPVATNFRFALDAYNRWKAGDYDVQVSKYKEGKALWKTGDNAKLLESLGLPADATPAAFREAWIDKHNLKPTQSNGKLFGANSDPVLRVLDGSWREEVQGPKTPNFADNLSGAGFEATIDVWAARLMHRLGNEGNPKRWRILPKNETAVADQDFFMSQKAFRLAGDELGISPDSLQAIVWFLEKEHWEKNGWTKAAGAEKSDFNTFLEVTARNKGSGKLSIDQAQLEKNRGVAEETPDLFAQFAPEKGGVTVEAKKSAVIPMPQEDAEKIADAIYKAEGGAKAKKPYGILSVKVSGEADARKVALNTIKNNYKRWQVAGRPGGYLEFLAGKYAPIGVANDPKALNKNWLKNVKAGLAR